MILPDEPRVVFGSSVEALFRAFGPPFNPRALASLRALGVDPEKPVQAAYPLELYMKVLAALADAHFPEGTEQERYFEIGCAFIRGFENTFVGRTQLALLRIIGPRRALERLTRSFRAVNNYAATELKTIAPHHHEVVITYVLQPGFYLGVLDAGLREVGAKELKVELASREGMSATYAVRWA